MSLKNKKNFIKDKTKNCCLSTTCHGIPNIFRTENNLIKCIWYFSILVGVSFSSYYIIESFIEYYKCDVNSILRIVNQIPMDFPAIDICKRLKFNF